MIDILVQSFREMGVSIAKSFSFMFNNLFILDGKINGYMQILIVGIVISVSAYVFKTIFKKVRMKK